MADSGKQRPRRGGGMDPGKLRLWWRVALCCLLLVGVALSALYATLRRQAFRANLDLARNAFAFATERLDERLLDDYARLSLLAKDDAVFWMKNWNAMTDKERIDRYGRASAQVAALRALIRDAAGAYVCYPSQGVVLADGLYDWHRYPTLREEEWLSLSNTTHNLFVRRAKGQDAVTPTALHLAVKVGSNPRRVGFAVLTLAPEALYGLDGGLLSGMAYAIADAQGNLLCTKGLPPGAWSGLSGEEATAGGERCALLSATLDFASLRVCMLIPHRALTDAGLLSDRLLPIGLTLALSALLIALIVSRVAFSPIERLCRVASETGARPDARGGVDYLSARIRSLVGENTRMADRLSRDRPYLRERTLLQLVTRPQTVAPTDEEFEEVGLRLTGPHFRLVVLHYEPGTGAARYAREALFDAFWSEGPGGGTEMYKVCYQPRRYVVVLSYDAEPEGENAWPAYVAGRLQWFHLNCRGVATAGISHPVDELAGLNRAFEEASDALERQLLVAPGLLGQPLLEGNDVGSFYPFELTAALARAIAGADEAALDALLAELTEWFRRKTPPNRFAMRQVFLSMSEDVRRPIRSADSGAADGATQADYAAVAGADDLPACIGAFSSLCRHLLAIMRTLLETRDLRLVRQVQAYIRDHFRQVESVETLAEGFGIGQTQLYHLFRTCLQTSPAQYLNEVRMENAANLLRQTEMPIAEIARQCGLNNAQRFFRNFKKAFGCTPSEYRTLNQP